MILLSFAVILTSAFMNVWESSDSRAWVEAITQGVLITGAAVLTDQIPKQIVKYKQGKTIPGDGK